MATTENFHDYVMDRLAPVGMCRSRRMMGEYCIYCGGKVIGLLCDNQFLLKPTESVLKKLPHAERVYPYEGAKTRMVVVEDLENTELLRRLIPVMCAELPEPKERRRKVSKYELLWKWIVENGTDSFKLTFAEIGAAAGIPLDHSFLKSKKELTGYGFAVKKISMKEETVTFERLKGTEDD